jgi:UDP-N-acetylmuramate dehydrogenase
MLEQHVSLKHMNTFGIEAFAEYFATFTDAAILQDILTRNEVTGMPGLVLGGGSNVLFTGDFEGIVLKNNIKGIEKIDEDNDQVYIKAGAGENWHQFVLYCLANNYAGVENLALIPGNVGASPMQNIGAYGAEIKDVFFALEAFDTTNHTLVTFNKEQCAFGYRESVFKNKYKGRFIITSVVYKLSRQPKLNTSYGAIEEELKKMNVTNRTIRDVAQAVINIRTSKLPDPAEIGNAGSFFKNPEIESPLFNSLKETHPGIVGYALDNGNVKLAAGWLIEQCGWKGYRKGDAGCHARQALVLVNYGHATGREILGLSEEIIASVQNTFNVKLEREVNII